ncbi:non-specific serine/threonine kinase domain protein [Mycobacterium avium subsp. avium 2285 (R)]|nr:non-specific serine/threonine kinase domain protein [Mycobacterium avium subsp. avium 2285 (R)]
MVTAVAVLMLIAGVVLSVKTVVGTHHNNSARRRPQPPARWRPAPDDPAATADSDAVASGDGRRRAGVHRRDGALRPGQPAGRGGAHGQVAGRGVSKP